MTIVINNDGVIEARTYMGSFCNPKNFTGTVYSGNGSCIDQIRVTFGNGTGLSDASDGIGTTLVIAVTAGTVCALGLVVLAIWLINWNKYAQLKNEASLISINNKVGTVAPAATEIPTATTTIPVYIQNERESIDFAAPEIEMFSILKRDPPTFLNYSKPTSSSSYTEKENPLFRGMNAITSFKGMEAAGISKYDGTPTPNDFIEVADKSNPQQWTVAQVAVWVSQNGGSPGHVIAQCIDGRALLLLGVEDLFTLLKIDAVGKQIQFSSALESLKAPPPSYLDT
ncbi:UNVERIFIED_CONTAM: hypothetical protein HDU68_009537 [Siphonaria sp. JEL0065]|nr:hypothetical protein HDU68_009537 [Siphonaria sp. JEL0065]